MALRQLLRFHIGLLLVILPLSIFQRSDGFNLQQWMSTHGSKFEPNRQIASADAGLESAEDEDDVYINKIISKSCPSGYFRDQEEKCVPLNDVPVASNGGGYVDSFGGGGPASCKKGQYLDHHSGQCSVCPAECRGDTRSASSSEPGSATCPRGQYLTSSGQCVSIFPVSQLHPPGQHTSNPHPHPASRSLLSTEAGCPPGQLLLPDGRCAPIIHPSSLGGYSAAGRALLFPPEAGCPPGQSLTKFGKCALIPYPSVPGGSFDNASRSALSRPKCTEGHYLTPEGKCALISNRPVLTGICPPGQVPVPPYGQCAPFHPPFLYSY